MILKSEINYKLKQHGDSVAFLQFPLDYYNRVAYHVEVSCKWEIALKWIFL